MVYYTCGSINKTSLDIVCNKKQYTISSEISEEEVNEIVSNASQASFGVGNKEVVDLEYRNAVVYKTDEFFSDLEISEILNEVQKILKPDHSIIAKKYRMNIYQKDGKFNRHKDTPKGSHHFGTLVVCLPMKFTGGILNLSFQDDSVDLDWEKAQGEKIQWAAFYGDTFHHITSVESGTRITITYDLFVEYNNIVSKNIKDLKNYESGTAKIYNCSHLYPSDSFNISSLKGEDYIFYKSLSEEEKKNCYLVYSSKAEITFNQEFQTGECVFDNGTVEFCVSSFLDYIDLSDASDFFNGKTIENYYVNNSVGGEYNSSVSAEQNNMFHILEDNYIRLNRKVTKVKDKGVREEGGYFATYGNEPSTGSFYVMLSILVDYPDERSLKQTETESNPEQELYIKIYEMFDTNDKENIARQFEDAIRTRNKNRLIYMNCLWMDFLTNIVKIIDLTEFLKSKDTRRFLLEHTKYTFTRDWVEVNIDKVEGLLREFADSVTEETWKGPFESNDFTELFTGLLRINVSEDTLFELEIVKSNKTTFNKFKKEKRFRRIHFLYYICRMYTKDFNNTTSIEERARIKKEYNYTVSDDWNLKYNMKKFSKIMSDDKDTELFDEILAYKSKMV